LARKLADGPAHVRVPLATGCESDGDGADEKVKDAADRESRTRRELQGP
jgi:hypothetical protein